MMRSPTQLRSANRQHLDLLRLAGALVGAASLATIACYSERVPPTPYRYACGSTDECTPDEQCIAGLCQLLCTTATFAQDCPQSGSYALCYNGVCANTCTIDNDACPPPQACVEPPIDLSSLGGGAQTAPLGLCGIPCDATSCPAGEVCLQGFCFSACVVDDDCDDMLQCIQGVCAPPMGTGDTGSDTGSDTSEGGS